MVYINVEHFEKMSQIFELLSKVENIRSRITEDEYTAFVENIACVHKDYYPQIPTAKTFQLTSKPIIQFIRRSLMNGSLNQSVLAVKLHNKNPTFNFRFFGFTTFKDWMEELGFDVQNNRVYNDILVELL
tara:strand:+ start:847 stop:1236 length:390 start_codon:yes stop_codon:yes gene_type:complete